VKVEMFVRVTADGAEESQTLRRRAYANACAMEEQTLTANSILHLVPRTASDQNLPQLSSWSSSTAKRFFDCMCVLAALPLVAPVLLIVSLAVRFTSDGPVFFRQQRAGSHGRFFTILKFRTMLHDPDKAYHPVTTDGNQPFTSIGPFLRRWKLDELPQIINVLRGEMSLVGPRPKMPEHVIDDLPCRPGVTGAATIAFAREETLLDQVPAHELESYYHSVVLPAKRRLDAEYMARATFLSDIRLIVNSVLRRWDQSVTAQLLGLEEFLAASSAYESAGGESDPQWKGGFPIRVASVAARVGARRSA
jgi:lipopolysaccharide/colanic/teichoic acid biosynthesis glycosyltransferase